MFIIISITDTTPASTNIIVMLTTEKKSKKNSNLSLFGRPVISILKPTHFRLDPKPIKHAAEVANAAAKVYFCH